MDRIAARAADREWLQQVKRESGALDHDSHFLPDYRAEADAVAAEVARAVAQRDFHDRQLRLLREVRARELARMRRKAKREASIAARLVFAIFGDRTGD
jgi:hypothetical protein